MVAEAQINPAGIFNNMAGTFSRVLGLDSMLALGDEVDAANDDMTNDDAPGNDDLMKVQR